MVFFGKLGKGRGGPSCEDPPGRFLAAGLFYKRLTIGTLRCGRVSLMGADLDFVQCAVIFILTVILALLHTALNARV